MFSNDLMKPFLFPTNMFSKSQVLVSCPALRFTFWDGKHFGLNKQVKPGFTNYQPRFSQIFIRNNVNQALFYNTDFRKKK